MSPDEISRHETWVRQRGLFVGKKKIENEVTRYSVCLSSFQHISWYCRLGGGSGGGGDGVVMPVVRARLGWVEDPAVNLLWYCTVSFI